MYELYVEKAAENDLKRLPATTFHRIIPQIRTLGENPRPSGCCKPTGSKNDWRIREGNGRTARLLAILMAFTGRATTLGFWWYKREEAANVFRGCTGRFGSRLHTYEESFQRRDP